jgi:hypothetical protein
LVLGITIAKTAGIIAGTFYIENHHAMLHDERDRTPMKEHLGSVAA